MIKLTAPDTYTATISGTEWSGITPDSRFWVNVQEMISQGEEVEDLTQPTTPTLEQERAGMACTRQQGKLALGSTVWASVLSLADDPDTPWGLKVAIEDTVEWRRTDEDMQALIWAMGLTEEQADDLFRLAMTL